MYCAGVCRCAILMDMDENEQETLECPYNGGDHQYEESSSDDSVTVYVCRACGAEYWESDEDSDA